MDDFAAIVIEKLGRAMMLQTDPVQFSLREMTALHDLIQNLQADKRVAEVERLRQQNAALLEACEALMREHLVRVPKADSYQCCYCSAVSCRAVSEFPHQNWCPVPKARAAVAGARSMSEEVNPYYDDTLKEQYLGFSEAPPRDVEPHDW